MAMIDMRLRISGRIFTVATIGLLVLAYNLGMASSQSASNVMARYHYYQPVENNWSLKAARASCYPNYDSKPLSWKKAYGWTGFCPSSGTTGEAACGKCLKVTSVATGATKTVRIVDQCKRGPLSLDALVFRDMDTDHTGLVKGYINVNYEFVTC